MKVSAENMVDTFLRTFPRPFTSREFLDFVKHVGIRSASIEECEDFLIQNDYVFSLNNGMFITRCAAFSEKYFSFRPTRKEVENRAFVVGHRCMPFADYEVLSCHYSFIYKNHLLPKVVVEYDRHIASEFFFLYGEEYENQYIVSDPANYGVDLVDTDFELPPKINITSVSLEPLLKDGFCFGDRILCKVIDWDSHQIEIFIDKANSNPFQINQKDIARENWYNQLEQDLLESFETIGPRKSIEEQLAIVMYNNGSQLCVPWCGSIEEFFTRTKKIDFEPYGVESRIWYAGKEVPAFGKWNCGVFKNLKEELKDVENSSDDYCLENAPDYIVDAYLKDCIAKDGPESVDELTQIIEKIYPNFNKISAAERKVMLLHLKNRHAILCSKFNRFAENEYTSIRHKAVELYSDVIEIVYSLDFMGEDICSYPQQPLVIFSQLYSHLIQIIKAIEVEPMTLPKDLAEVSMSLTGMQDNFEYILGDLKEIIEQQKKNGFVVLK